VKGVDGREEQGVSLIGDAHVSRYTGQQPSTEHQAPSKAHLWDQAHVHHPAGHGRLHGDEAAVPAHELDDAQPPAAADRLDLRGGGFDGRFCWPR